MKCICGHKLIEAKTCEQHKLNDKSIVIIDIPVLQCPSCQEIYYDDVVLDKVDELLSKVSLQDPIDVLLYNYKPVFTGTQV